MTVSVVVGCEVVWPSMHNQRKESVRGYSISTGVQRREVSTTSQKGAEELSMPPLPCSADVDEGPFLSSLDDNVCAILERIQNHVFQRRIRSRDKFADYDPLHAGRCTQKQFVRAVNALDPSISQEEAETLAGYFQDRNALPPQVVHYNRFCRAIDEVFNIDELEKVPCIAVPTPGSTLQHGRSLVPSARGGGHNPAIGASEEKRIREILHKIALLVKTRGIMFLNCFQDCDRSNATSLVTPRHSGKATPSQFRQQFPFMKDFSEEDVDMIVSRFSTEGGDVHYLALVKDVEAVVLHPPTRPAVVSPFFAPGCTPPTGGLASAAYAPRRINVKDTVFLPDAMDKLTATISDRRVRMHDKFQDFDRLRLGVCGMHHVKTVFTVVGAELEQRELDVLEREYSNNEGLFKYRDFLQDFATSYGRAKFKHPLSARESTLAGKILSPAPGLGGNGTREVFPAEALRTARSTSSPADAIMSQRLSALGPTTEAELNEIEVRIRKQVQMRALPLKTIFADFDRTNSGRVTRTQFSRALDMLNIKVQEQQLNLLGDIYCDASKRWEIKYLDFCSAVDVRADWVATRARYDTVPSSKYFNRKGQITPHPMRSNMPGGHLRPISH